MQRYLLDTNILLLFLRQDTIWSDFQLRFDLNKSSNFISVVSLGELRALALRNQWGERRMKELETIETHFVVVDINIKSIINCYGEIDAFSQGKLRDKPLKGSSRSMGKNDLWTASTASILRLTLLTTDLDFNHLNNIFLDLKTIDLSTLR